MNRDRITYIARTTGPRGSVYHSAQAHLCFNSQTYRYVAETPEQIMKAPCVAARGDPTDPVISSRQGNLGPPGRYVVAGFCA